MPVPLESLPQASRELVRLLRATLAGLPPAPATDWPAGMALATWHGVDAFLYPALVALPTDRQPPGAVLAAWRQQFLAAAANTVRREEQTRELLSALAAATVRAVPLKGTWLAARVYADPSQRAMADIDLLVSLPDLATARDAIARLGYLPYGNTASVALDCDQTYICPRHAWPLELHWNLGVASRTLHRPEVPGLWQRLVPEELLGVSVHVLCPEEHLVYLAYHVLHHHFRLPLRAYLDLVLLGCFLGTKADRTRLNAIAAEWGMEQALPRVMAIAYDLFEQELPAPLADWMPDAEAPQREQAVFTILQSTAHGALPAERTLLAFQQRRPIARIGLVLRRVFLPREFLRREYPCARWWIGLPLAYLLRGRDLLRRNAGPVRRVLQHDPAVDQQLDEAAAREELMEWALGTDRT